MMSNRLLSDMYSTEKHETPEQTVISRFHATKKADATRMNTCCRSPVMDGFWEVLDHNIYSLGAECSHSSDEVTKSVGQSPMCLKV